MTIIIIIDEIIITGFFLLFKGKDKTINQELANTNRRYLIIKNNLIINKERNLLKIYND